MRGWISSKALLAGGCVLLSACATNMEYVPTEQVSAQLQGRPASQYRVPPESPRGDVTVVSRGVVQVERDGHRADVLHVAVRLSNDQDSGPWTFDVREQKLLVPGAGSITPAPVSPAAGGAPVVNVAPGAQRTMDLYFPTPPGVKTNRLHAFDLLWTVRTPQRIVTERTPFEEWGSDGYGYGYGTVTGMGHFPRGASELASARSGGTSRSTTGPIRSGILTGLPPSATATGTPLATSATCRTARAPARCPRCRRRRRPPCRARGRHHPCRAFRCRRLRQRRPRPRRPRPAPGGAQPTQHQRARTTLTSNAPGRDAFRTWAE